jgi:hypothetical protein
MLLIFLSFWQHDYDCFTRLRLNGKDAKRRHSYAGVSKASAAVASPARSKTPGRMQDIAVLRAAYERSSSGSSSKGKGKATESKAEREKEREHTPARVVGERMYFPGSPAPVTTAQLLEEAEREVVNAGVVSPSRSAKGGESISFSASARRTSARGVPLPDSDDEGDAPAQEEGAREWAKADWKTLDACFTDERIAVAARLGMVLNLSPAPAPRTPVRLASTSASSDGGPAVMMASADAVDLGAVVRRFVTHMGGERVVRKWGDAWDV